MACTYGSSKDTGLDSRFLILHRKWLSKEFPEDLCVLANWPIALAVVIPSIVVSERIDRRTLRKNKNIRNSVLRNNGYSAPLMF